MSNIFIHNVEGRDLIQVGDYGISSYKVEEIKKKIKFELEIFENYEFTTPEEIIK